jgi:hypothetical protein
MREFEFTLVKNFRQRGALWWIVAFLLFLIPSWGFRIFFTLVVLARGLPREYERGEGEVTLQYPIRKWELFLYDFLAGISVLVISGLFSSAITEMRMGFKYDTMRIFLTFPYIYGLSVLCAKYLKSAFFIPLVFIVLDFAFWWTGWKIISPLSQSSFVGTVISFLIFFAAFSVYSEVKLRREQK